jgi:hypothetical protein
VTDLRVGSRSRSDRRRDVRAIGNLEFLRDAKADIAFTLTATV